MPGVDQVFVFDKREVDRGVRGILRVGRQVRGFAPEVALVSHPSLRSGALAWVSRAKQRIGYAPMCNERHTLDRRRPFVDRALVLAAHIGAPAEDRRLELRAPPELADYAERAVGGAARPITGLVPGAEWPTKRWGEEKFASLARELAGRGGTLLLLGGPAEREAARRIVEASGVPIRNTVGNSIPEAVALLAHCDLVVGGDTGLVHCARALGRPSLVLFGPTDPGRHVFASTERPVRVQIACAPCHDHGPRRCPLSHHRCLVDLEVEPVARLARELLTGTGHLPVATN